MIPSPEAIAAVGVSISALAVGVAVESENEKGRFWGTVSGLLLCVGSFLMVGAALWWAARRL